MIHYGMEIIDVINVVNGDLILFGSDEDHC